MDPLVSLALWEPGEPGSPPVDVVATGDGALLAKHGLTGVALRYCAERSLTPAAETTAWADHLDRKSLAIDGSLQEVSGILDASGSRWFVAKGPAIAHVAESDPRLRPYTDLDVYVPAGAEHDRARTALLEGGYRPVVHARGALDGLDQELQGGAFGAVVELHAHPIDNLHRHHLPPVEAFAEHIERRPICGADVAVLSPAAHLALQGIHLATGHRYAKLVLLRDLARQLHLAGDPIVAELAATGYVGTAADLLAGLGAPVPAVPAGGGVTRAATVRALLSQGAGRWDEYRLSRANVLALLDQPSWRTALRCAVLSSRSLLPVRGRRVPLRGPLPGSPAGAPPDTSSPNWSTS